MTTILKQTSNIKNGLIGSTVSFTGNTTATSNPYITTTSGTAGQFLTSTGSNGTTWTTGTTTPYDAVLVANQNPASLEVKGRMVINGRDLEERLNTIEKVLSIPERDVILEKKHPKLKKLYEEYINELSKYKMWQSIKGDND